MKVGIYDPYLDDMGGGEKYMMTIAACLSKQHGVSVFWDTRKELDAVGTRFSLDLSSVKIVPNIFSPHVSLIKRFFKTREYDAIIVLTDGSIPLVGARKLFLHIQQPLASMQVHSLFEKIKLSRVNGFFCNSHYTEALNEKKFSIAACVIYPPVALSLKEVVKGNIILHVGRFRSVSGVDYKKQGAMIGAFKKMIDSGLKNWKFVIATSVREKDIPEFNTMKETAKGYPIEFLINQPNTALWHMYSQAKIYWHASGFGENLETHPELAEHFGISTVEAMGAGAVPVVINAGGQKEIVKDHENGLLWNTLEELQQKTLTLIQDKEMLEKLSKSARQTAGNFTEDRFCKEIYQLIA